MNQEPNFNKNVKKMLNNVSVTARQQTYCASYLEQGGGEVPAPSVLKKKGRLWNDSRNLLEKRWRDPRDGPCLM